MKSGRRPPIVAYAAAALLCLVLISVSLTSRMFARYTAGAQIPENHARTAAFEVSAEAPTEDPVTIIANGTDENGKAVYTIKVKNDSEVAVRYNAIVEFTGEKATENKEKFDDSDDKLSLTGELAPKAEADRQITFDMSAYFETNDKYNTFSNDDISGDKGKVPFEVRVTFTQID